MSYSFYKVLHLFGAFLTLAALGGLALHAAIGREKAENTIRGFSAAMHGVGLLILLVAGFGALAKLGVTGGFPGWVWAKLAIWVVFGAAVALPYRSQALAKHLLWILPLLAALNGYLAIYKPF